MREKKFISIVVYLHDGEKEIGEFLDTVIPVCEDNFESYEIVCVNDGCRDKTLDILKEYLEDKKVGAMVNIIHMSFFQGMEAAMNAGRDIAIGDFVYEFDTPAVDYKKDVILEVYHKLQEGKDIVAASRGSQGRFTSRIFYSIYNMTSRSSFRIGQESFRILSRRAINRIKSMGVYIPYRKAVYGNCGLLSETVYYKPLQGKRPFRDRVPVSQRAGLALDSFIYFTNMLERASAVISFLFLAITVGVGIYILADVFSERNPVEGWLSTMGFLALGFFGVFTLLTIILKYLSVMLNLIFRQQRYLITDIEKVGKTREIQEVNHDGQ